MFVNLNKSGKCYKKLSAHLQMLLSTVTEKHLMSTVKSGGGLESGGLCIKTENELSPGLTAR